MSFERFDPFDPAQASRHHEVMAELRSSCPAARLASGMIVVSRYEDVRSTLNVPTMLNRGAARAPGVEVPPEDRLFFFEYDPPEHSALRRLLVDLLSRPRAERRAPGGPGGRRGDPRAPRQARSGHMVQEFSVPLSGRMMMQVAGFPEEDAGQWRRWIKDMVVSGFSFTNRNERESASSGVPDALAYLDQHLALRVAAVDKPDDILTRVLEARVDGDTLSSTQKRMILFSVVSSGHEHPGQLHQQYPPSALP